MWKWILLLLLKAGCVPCWAQKGPMVVPAIIPQPVTMVTTNEVFTINKNTVVVTGVNALQVAADLLSSYLNPVVGKLSISGKPLPGNTIYLQLDTTRIKAQEGYELTVDHNSIQLLAANVQGILNGIQTLRQLWQLTGSNTVQVPGVVIKDQPRFAYRGMALDVSRHFFSIDFIKKYIDWLALYKFNTFHWHLTDDQGWRIEIKQYPRLQTIAAWRSETLIGHKKELPHRFDGKRYGGFYTQHQVKEVVQYATERNITIIPEIEMPGHALAALAAYPQLGCTGGPYKAATFWGIFEEPFCAGNDSTFIFLQNVLDEVMQLFPAAYLHVGGDECVKTRWKNCVKCQRRMQEEGLKDEEALQSYFIHRIEKYVNSKGRHIIGWDEILEGGLAPNATVMSWRGEEGSIAAAQQHHAVIMTPESHAYFDYYQSLYAQEPLAAGGYTPLSKVYAYDPAGTMDPASLAYVKGLEGQAWSEYFDSEQQAQYMIFPRAIALAEIAWTPADRKNYSDFLQRLRRQQKLLQQQHINVFPYFDELTVKATVAGRQKIVVQLESSLPGSSIHYTLDGTVPSLQSPQYKDGIQLATTGALKARLFTSQGKAASRIWQQFFYLHKAVGATVTLLHAPIARFNASATGLVNGQQGTDRYNDGQWMGFSGDDLEVVIDLVQLQSLHSVQLNVLNYHWQKMWAPTALSIFVSVDNKTYKKVFTQMRFSVNGINRVTALLKGNKARYIKITGINKGVIPPGAYGAGAKALLMIDEIKVQ